MPSDFPTEPGFGFAGVHFHLRGALFQCQAGQWPSFQDDFRSIAAAVGSTLESSRLTKLSAEAVRDAAVAAEDEVSGVNMDEEAAKLITQQQAYQAAAQVINTVKTLFDTLIQSTR